MRAQQDRDEREKMLLKWSFFFRRIFKAFFTLRKKTQIQESKREFI